MRAIHIGLLAGIFAALTSGEGRSADHWTTTNGVHKGVIQWRSEGSGADPPAVGGLGYIGSFQISYALWELQGQPLHDYAFTWDWLDRDNLNLGKGEPAVRAKDLLVYPDLRKRFLECAPASLEFSARIDFFDTAGKRIATGRKTIPSHMLSIPRAGAPAGLHLPGSPNWDNFFEVEGEPAKDRAAWRKELFTRAASVVLSAPQITRIDWVPSLFEGIAKDYRDAEAAARREVEQAAQAAAQAASRQFAATNTDATKLPSGPNPFDQAANSNAPANPFEQAAARTPAGPQNPFERAKAVEAQFTVPPNPFEQANATVTGPENPFERAARLKREEDARLAALARKRAEEAAEAARLAELARLEAERQERIRIQIAMEEQERQALQARWERQAQNEAASQAPASPRPGTGWGRPGPYLTIESRPAAVLMVTCSTCGGSGKCSFCKGRGGESRGKCPFCEGAGVRRASPTSLFSEQCRYCNGHGWSWSDCPHCSGGNCKTCSGYGRVGERRKANP